MSGNNYKNLSDKRRKALEEIRCLIKKECGYLFQQGCLQNSIVEILKHILEQGKANEKGRNAFRDELIRLGYNHQDLTSLVENNNEKSA